MKRQLLFASGLTVSKSRELFGVSEDQFDLKPQPVEAHRFHRTKVAVGRSLHDVGLCFRVNKHRRAKVAREMRAGEPFRVNLNVRLVFEGPTLSKRKRSPKSTLPSKIFGPPGPPFREPAQK